MFAIRSLAALAQSAGDDGLTLGEIIGALPTDPASIFALLLLLGGVGTVLWYGMKTRGGGGEGA